jgi:alpha-L-arabinofuranosidase
MIWFSNNDVYGSVNYYIQKMYANNVGTKILNTEFKKTEGTGEKKVLSGKIGLGTWETAAEFDDLKVVSNKTKKILYTQNFKNETSIKDAEVVEGNFKVTNGVLKQLNSGAAKNTNTGDVAYFGDEDWSDYTMTVKATATSGKEGFIIPIAVKDKDNCFFWNFGGWGNTVSCLQQVENGAKSDQITGTVKDMSVQYGKEYDLKIVVSGNNIKCYSFGALVIDYTYKTGDSIYQTVSFDEVSNDVIVKLVNVKAEDIDVTLTLPTADLYNKEAKLIQLKGNSGSDTNSLNAQEKVITTESTISVSKEFTYKVPKLSATIIRIHKLQ